MIKKDHFIIATSGIYSDYFISGAFIALEDFDVNKELVDFEKDHPMEKPIYDWVKKDVCWNKPPFINWLIDHGKIKKTQGFEIWVGEYDYNITPKDIRASEIDTNIN